MRQHDETPLAQRTRQMRNGRIDRHHTVERRDQRRRIAEVLEFDRGIEHAYPRRMCGELLDAMPDLQRHRQDPLELEEPRQSAKAHRPLLIVRMRRPPLPNEADGLAPARRRRDARAPRRALRRIGLHIRNAARNRLQRRTEHHRQARQRDLEIERRNGLPPVVANMAPGDALDQHLEFRADAHEHLPHPLAHQR